MPDGLPRNESLALDLKQRIDRICDRFEAEWKAAQRPQIETYIARSGGRPRTELLRELLAIELEYRARLGEQPSIEEYDVRFPGDVAVIREAFHRASIRKPAAPTKPAAETVDWSGTIEEHAPARRAAAESPARSVGAESATPAPRAVASGASKTFGRFKIIKLLGRGAFGSVYQAHDPQLDRYAALKIPHAGTIGSEDDAQRFLREARAVGQLRHPYIVPVFDAGKVGNTYYIASAYIEGTALRHAIQAGRFDKPRKAAEVIRKLATALNYAHEQGIVHRDIKPENILVDAVGHPYVLDFGLARRDDAVATRTQDGTVMGTPVYMSPEQAGGKSHLADGRSDLWSLGVILYELLCEARPFAGTGHELYAAILEQQPIAPRKRNPAIPRDLETITLKCLAKEPKQRYQSCAELAEDLQRWFANEPIAARRAGPMERCYRWCRRNPVLAGLSAAAALLLGIVAAVASVGYTSTSHALAKAEEERQRAEERRQQADRALAALDAEARQRKQSEQALIDEAEQRNRVQQSLNQETGLRKRAENEREEAEEKRTLTAAELDANKAELASNRQELLKAARARDERVVVPANIQPPKNVPAPAPPDEFMQALSALKPDLDRAKGSAREIKPRLDEAEVQLKVLLEAVGIASQRIQTLSNTVTGTEADEIERQTALSAARMTLAGVQQQVAMARKVVDDVSDELNVPLSELEDLRVRWFNLMDLFGRRSPEDHQRSIAHFDQWLLENHDDQATHLARCVAYWQTRQLEKALTDLQPLIDAKGAGLADYLAIRGMLLCESNNEREGMAALSQSVKLDKNCWLAYVFRAQANLLHERYENAMHELKLARQVARQVAANQLESLRLTALIQATCTKQAFRDGEKALATAQQACAITKNGDWRCLESLAAAYAEAGKFEEATRSIDAAAGLCDGMHRDRCNEWKKQFEAQQPIRLSPRECIGITDRKAK